MTSLILDNSGITSFTSVTFPSDVRFLSARANKLTNLQGLPATVEILDVSNNKQLTSLLGSTNNLKQLIVNNCGLITFQNVSTALRILEANYNAITGVTNLSICTVLAHIQLDNNLITSMQGLQTTACQFLSIEYNLLTTLTFCPSALIKASFRGNAGIGNGSLSSLPTGLRSLDLQETGVTNYSSVPSTVRELLVGSVTNLNTATSGSNITQVQTTGSIYKTTTLNANVQLPSALTSTATQQAYNSMIPFSIPSSTGQQISDNNWTLIGTYIPFSAAFVQGATTKPAVYVIASLKVITSIDIRVLASDISPSSPLLNATALTTAAITVYKFPLIRVPTVDCILELNARVGAGQSGSVNAKYGLIYGCVLYM